MVGVGVARSAVAAVVGLSLVGALLGALPAQAQIHTAPVVVPGFKVKPLTHYPISMYRVFRTDADGKAVIIPFQIDEINEIGDYVLPEGEKITANTGNGIFDLQDELAFMGDDVGPVKAPTSWGAEKPALTYEIKVSLGRKNKAGLDEGAVYVGIYFRNAPPLSKRNYVNFNRKTAEVVTTRYRYGFDQKNWLVARRVEMLEQGTASGGKPKFVPLLESTTFYMKADLKYFLTVTASHRSINSKLEAWKTGPVRTIVRISFQYTFLKLNFDIGMYTEISFFSNAVYLPAILYNPLEGTKNLNTGSGFYYGLALRDNPSEFKIETNMPAYKPSGFLDFLSGKPDVKRLYWLSAYGKDRMLYMEVTPSSKMRKAGAVPLLYQEQIAGTKIKDRGDGKPEPLGKSPVNMGLYFDMTRFTEGEHNMGFRLFFENINNPEKLESFRTLNEWEVAAERLKGF